MADTKQSNLEFWNKVQASDPKTVKEVKLGRKFNTVNAHAQVKRATEMWGMFGKGWGVRNEAFTMLEPGLLLYEAELFYPDGKFEISSSITTHFSSGKLDDECVKKVATDALTKGLSKVGFNADIFLGMWEDNRYVSALKEQSEKVDQGEIMKQLETATEKSQIEAIWRNNVPLQKNPEFVEAVKAAGARVKETADG